MSGTVAPSPVKEPRIVFTGVSGAAMTKMKEVCSECLCVMYILALLVPLKHCFMISLKGRHT